jgi:hypothetical protein
MITRVILFSTLAAVSLFTAAGCGKGKLYKLEGVVTLNDQPVPGATVTFIPTGSGPPASGLTDETGTFRLTTYNTGDGVKEGEYKVTVKVSEAGSGGGAGPDVNDPAATTKAMAEYAKKSRENKAADAKKKPVVHLNYSDAGKTPLRQQVPSDGKVELKLNASGN